MIQRKQDEARKTKLLLDHPVSYQEDGIYTKHICAFLEDPDFIRASSKGCQFQGVDHCSFRWRLHVILWAAQHGLQLEGDFIECGVNRGFLSASVMEYLNWNSLDRHFYLLDTFCGLQEEKLTEKERQDGSMDRSKAQYFECFDDVKKNFQEFKNVYIVRGAIPDTLEQVQSSRVAYLSIDMNCALPEVAALEYFWPKLAPSAIVVLDDYAYDTFNSTHEQRKAIDSFAKSVNTAVVSLPTGQGMLIKPALG
ncbi:MAG: hypothetical protein S4CHLAM81_06220 [Chlamydiales bacterium]|nr:hypothetical protein [Chlamydiales bacterium]MCH9635406.1 hypothetical protein [Chlamydiales bacterium]